MRLLYCIVMLESQLRYHCPKLGHVSGGNKHMC